MGGNIISCRLPLVTKDYCEKIWSGDIFVIKCVFRFVADEIEKLEYQRGTQNIWELLQCLRELLCEFLCLSVISVFLKYQC